MNQSLQISDKLPKLFSISGKVVEVLPVFESTDKKGNWYKRQEIVIVIENGRYPLKLALCLFNHNIDVLQAGDHAEFLIGNDLIKTNNHRRYINNLNSYSVKILNQ